MGAKIFLGLVFIIVAVSLLILYWFVPISNSEFFIQSQSPDFSIGENSQALQFYENMRFPSSTITYRIGSCTIQKKEDMKRAFTIVAQKTDLSFVEVGGNEEITVNCESKSKIEGGLFIAGEGGPTNITKAGEFNVITKGQILLLKDSSCPNPNIAIHELLHVLGFDHTNNPRDIMYPVSRCDQEISNGTIEIINTLYSIPSYPDLTFDVNNVSASMHGRYLNVNLSVRNNGFEEAPESEIFIYADDSVVKKIDVEPLMIGHGRRITLTNVWVSQLSVENIILKIVAPYDELKKENNKVLLKIKK